MWIITFITFIFCIIKGVFGYISNSLALMADAGHNLTYVFALGLSAFAITITKHPADNKLTFGYHRVGIIVAVINALILVVMARFIF